MIMDKPDHVGPQALIIVPTRELALQIDQAVEAYSYFTGTSSVAIYGGGDGQDFYQEKLAILNGVDIIIATPGRLISHMNVGHVDFTKLRFLILDEADSFLREREGARRGWEITIVNEMLTQMEAFEGIFFATTNLMDHLDTASLRRFDMKINFGYLKFDQRLILTQSVCDALKLDPTPHLEECLQQLDQLTPGDFDNVLRQSRLRPIRAVTDLIDRLKQETRLKTLSASRPIGF
jgi:hypothetical protein